MTLFTFAFLVFSLSKAYIPFLLYISFVLKSVVKEKNKHITLYYFTFLNFVIILCSNLKTKKSNSIYKQNVFTYYAAARFIPLIIFLIFCFYDILIILLTNLLFINILFIND